MKIYNLIPVLFFLVSMAGAYSAPGPNEVFDWVAYPEAGNPELVNPAGFSFVNSLRLRLGMAASDSTFEGFDRVSIAFPGAGISGWWDDDVSMRRFTLSSSMNVFENIASIGVGYTWFDPTVIVNPFSGKNFYTLGMIIRPIEWFSFGLVRRGGMDLPGDAEVEAIYRAGFAVRPLGEDLTIVTNLETGTDFEDYKFSAGVEVRPMEGLSIRADAGEDYLSLGLEAGFGSAALSYGATSDDDYSYSSSRGDITFSTGPGPDLLGPSGIFVRFETGQFDELRQRPFLGSVQPCFTETALLLDRIASDNSVSGVIVDIERSAGSPAQVEEIRNLLQRIRESGKKVYFYVEYISNGGYYLASCGSSIWIHPCGEISFIGLASETFFLREFLDRVGIYPDLLHIGEYKSASDMLTRSDMSDAQRRATSVLLESLQLELTAGVANGTGLEPAQLYTIMNAGPYSAERAVTAGMVNGVCYQDQIEEKISEELGREISIVSIENYAESIPDDDQWGPNRHIAVVVATGLINRGGSGSSFPFGRIMGSESICDVLQEAASQTGVQAIVLRIDSPGGDALASADMNHAVERVRRRIPVIVSMGGVAASGGYAMACGADRIFAERMTITGSIGIISGKFSFGGLLDSLGINIEEVSTAPMASMNSSFRPYTERERGRTFDLLEDGYNLFVEMVAEGRGMTFEEVDSVGQGRVWSGMDALGIGLIDEYGGVVDAVYYAAGLTGMDIDEVPEVRIYPTPSFPGAMELPGFGVSESLIEFLGSEQVLYLMQPVSID
ncbi:MAG: signal peptide peptidase SppA [Candidatus Aegiribacteria sp.]|nr:signal peptide peptidase SppA [Candidatus Aegiribacteria sp.]